MHDNEFLSKLREYENLLDLFMDHHNGEEEELEYDPYDIDDDHPKLRRLRGEVE